jgi:MFS family permease
VASFYAVIPMLLGVYSGRLADMRGARVPLLIGAITTAMAMLTGFPWRDIAGLLAVTMLMGGGFVFFNVSIQTLVGGIGRPEYRAQNFAWLSIGYSMSSFIGPVFAGFSIDHAGHALTFLFFSFFLIFKPNLVQVPLPTASARKSSSMELQRDPPLRRLIIISGLSVASSELFAFCVPVFTHQIGLSATTTGLILGAYAVAVVLTRFMLGSLTRRSRPDQIMVAVACCAMNTGCPRHGVCLPSLAGWAGPSRSATRHARAFVGNPLRCRYSRSDKPSRNRRWNAERSSARNTSSGSRMREVRQSRGHTVGRALSRRR